MSEFVSDRQKKILELLDTSGARLHALLGRLTLSQDAAGDLMQELFLRLSKSGRLDKVNDRFAYAYRAAINLAFEWRKSKKVKFQSLDEDCLPAGNSPNPLAKMVRAEELAQVLDMMGRLSELAREVVVMHYIEQESYEAIGQRLGKKPQHIRSVSAKAMARLRELLTGERVKPGSWE